MNLGLLAISLLLTGLLAEGLVRVAAPQQLVLKRPDIWQPVAGRGWVHRPNVSTTINTGEGTVAVYTDPAGFRVGAHGRRSGDKRVLILGDSFLEAFQVEYEESIGGLLEERLPRLVGTSVSVRNTAVGGWDPPQYLLQARRTLDTEPFDLVLVFLYVGNDIRSDFVENLAPRAPAAVHRLRFPTVLSADELRDAVLYPINDVLETRSHLFVFFKSRGRAFLRRLGLTAGRFPPVFLKSERQSGRWTKAAEIAAAISDLAASRSVPAMFILLPHPVQLDPAGFEREAREFGVDPSRVDLEQPNRLLATSFAARGLDLIDPLATMRDRAAGEALFGEVDRHLNAHGHAVVTGSIEGAVARTLMEAGSGPTPE